jgi:hypothetical protein
MFHSGHTPGMILVTILLYVFYLLLCLQPALVCLFLVLIITLTTDSNSLSFS